jgi:hypothetical protein
MVLPPDDALRSLMSRVMLAQALPLLAASIRRDADRLTPMPAQMRLLQTWARGARRCHLWKEAREDVSAPAGVAAERVVNHMSARFRWSER